MQNGSNCFFIQWHLEPFAIPRLDIVASCIGVCQGVSVRPV